MGKNKGNEYEDIYNSLGNLGFLFEYNKRLSKSKTISQKELSQINPIKINSDSIVVVCKQCKEYMDFVAGPTGIIDGFWICPNCGVKVKERTVYMQLEKENNNFEEDLKFSDDDIPDGCKKCGGPWPSCETSCKIFDD